MDTSNLQHDKFPSFDPPMKHILRDIFKVPLPTGYFILDIDVDMTMFIDFSIHLENQGIDWQDHSHFTKDAFDAYSIPIIFARLDSTQTCTRPTSDYDEVQNITAATVPPPAPVLVRPLNVDTPETPPRLPGSTPNANDSPPTACKTAAHSTVDNSETPTGLPCSSNSHPNTDSTPTGTHSYTWNNIHPGITTGDVPSQRTREPHSTRARTSSPSPANSRWTFYPQSETVPSCISDLQLPSSGAIFKDSVVPSSVHAYSQHGASSCSARKPLYGAHEASSYPVRKPLQGVHSMNYNLPAVYITKLHRDAIKLKLYHLHATLLCANWIYDTVTCHLRLNDLVPATINQFI
eukprot:jgi/Psemu1/26025/gm1.26025_g